jgi:hypothetical protein
MTYRRTTTLTVLRVVEEFHDDNNDETPSLPAQRVYDTTCDDVTETRGIAKCGPAAIQSRRKAGRK